MPRSPVAAKKTMFKLNIFNFHIELQSLLAVISTQITFILSAIVFYVLTVGLLLYASSVFILFTFDPLVMTGVATRNATIGLALLSFLVGLAAASNRAAINVFKVFKSYFFYKVGKYQHVG